MKSVPNKTLAINGTKTESLTDLRDICARIRTNGTVRQLARALAHPIFLIASKFGYVGQLWKAFKVYRAEIDSSLAIQTCEYYFDQPFTNLIITDAISQRAKGRRGAAPGKQSRKGGGGKKNKNKNKK